MRVGKQLIMHPENITHYSFDYWPEYKNYLADAMCIKYCVDNLHDNYENEASIIELSKSINTELLNMNLYCFITSKEWLQDNKVQRHRRLWKSMIEMDSFFINCGLISEILFENNGKIRKALIANIKKEHFNEVIKHTLSNHNILLFSIQEKHFEESEIVSDIFLSSVLDPEIKLSDFICLPKFVNKIVELGGVAILPYGSKDFGAVCVDVFKKKIE